MTTRTRKYVTAFAGARDAYQVPLALSESNQLDRLVTDLYLPKLPDPISTRYAKLARRTAPGLSVWNTRSSLSVVWQSYVRWRFSSEPAKQQLTSLRASQDALSRLAAERAIQTSSDLFLYAGYALEAFRNPKLTQARRILFMYHPHIRRASDILIQDALQYPDAKSSIAYLKEDCADETSDRELELADLIVCASEFTASTIRAIGIDARKVQVIPYGIDILAPVAASEKSSDRCHFLFVGSGIHRKGLHVLCEAWNRARPSGATLTIVCRYVHPWIRARADIEGISLVGGVAPDELERLYRSANVFVLPSLVEGFGYVYLEALARGCFCIGTSNTGLPDLQLSPSEAVTIPAGDPDALAASLTAAHKRWHDRQMDPRQIQHSIQPWTWSRFRDAIATSAAGLQK